MQIRLGLFQPNLYLINTLSTPAVWRQNTVRPGDDINEWETQMR